MSTEIKNRIDQLMVKDNTHPKDTERESLFYIIAGNEELWKLREEIYNFDEHCIEPDILESGVCASSKTLIKVGFNLFNSYPTDSLIDCFAGLDDHNFELVMQAIRIRFDRAGA